MRKRHSVSSSSYRFLLSPSRPRHRDRIGESGYRYTGSATGVGFRDRFGTSRTSALGGYRCNLTGRTTRTFSIHAHGLIGPRSAAKALPSFLTCYACSHDYHTLHIRTHTQCHEVYVIGVGNCYDCTFRTDRCEHYSNEYNNNWTTCPYPFTCVFELLSYFSILNLELSIQNPIVQFEFVQTFRFDITRSMRASMFFRTFRVRVNPICISITL